MEVLDKTPGIIGYAVIKAEDGSIEEIKGSTIASLGELVAYFSSAGEVVVNSLSLGNLNHLTINANEKKIIVFPHGSRYLGIETEKDRAPNELIKQIESSLELIARPKFELPRSINSKIQQINLLVDEFGSPDKGAYWIEQLNQGLAVLGRDILPYLGIIEGRLIVKEKPPDDKEDNFVQGLRSVIDFLVKKGVLEMGSSQARLKVQAVIDRMK